MLSFFIKEHKIHEIMTYCDADWSNGKSYEKLGFSLVSKTGEIEYLVDNKTNQRTSIKKIRRDVNYFSPELCFPGDQILRTQGNLKFIARFG